METVIYIYIYIYSGVRLFKWLHQGDVTKCGKHAMKTWLSTCCRACLTEPSFLLPQRPDFVTTGGKSCLRCNLPTCSHPGSGQGRWQNLKCDGLASQHGYLILPNHIHPAHIVVLRACYGPVTSILLPPESGRFTNGVTTK